MVWIHGGSFTSGSGDAWWFGPSLLVNEGVVVVTLNYRLGILGFLSSGDGEIQGNYGLKDQVMALKWVQENIAAYGGDPNEVTIFGESAGSCSVSFLPKKQILLHYFLNLKCRVQYILFQLESLTD